LPYVDRVMYTLENDSVLFSEESIKTIERMKSATYVCDTELPTNGAVPVLCSIFYGDEAHPVSGSHYFAMFYDFDKRLMITNGSFVENQSFTGVVADDNSVIYSRHRHDYRTSGDGSVFVDGGRDYIRTNASRTVELVIKGATLHVNV
jgi:hypothetical protein